LGPESGDEALAALGRLAAAWPPRRKVLDAAVARGRSALGVDWDLRAARSALAANVARSQARDYPLDFDDDAAALGRFDVRGSEHVTTALARGRGLILLGSHLGAYLS